MSDFKKQKVNQDNTVITKKNNYEDVKLDAYLFIFDGAKHLNFVNDGRNKYSLR